jgi:hypothetical protein
MGDQRVIFTEVICGAVVKRETIKKGAALLCVGVYGIVDRMLLVNGQAVVLEMKEMCERILEGPVCECGPVFRQLACVSRYVKCEAVQVFQILQGVRDFTCVAA